MVVTKTKPIILIADDSSTFLMYITILLQRMGFDVVAAENGEEVFKLGKIVVPDLIMLDVIMPKFDGITTLQYLNNDMELSGIPVIMVSSSMNDMVIKECKQSKCAGYLTKPINITALNDIIQRNVQFSNGRRRHYLRTALRKKVGITCDGVMQECHAISLSEGGIYVRRRDPLANGSLVEVSIPITEETILHLKGEVIYQKEIGADMIKIAPGMAIRFTEFNAGNASLLRAYIVEMLTGDILQEQEEEVIARNDIATGPSN